MPRQHYFPTSRHFVDLISGEPLSCAILRYLLFLFNRSCTTHSFDDHAHVSPQPPPRTGVPSSLSRFGYFPSIFPSRDIDHRRIETSNDLSRRSDVITWALPLNLSGPNCQKMVNCLQFNIF